MVGGSYLMRFSFAVTVAMYGTNLPLSVIFKGVPVGRVDQYLPDTIPGAAIGCVQRKEWMDNRTISIWNDSVYTPYVTVTNGHSGLLLDDLSVTGALNCCKR